MNSLHRSLSHISASLSHKIGEFYFSFKFGISRLLHQWSLQNSLHKGWLNIVIGEFLLQLILTGHIFAYLVLLKISSRCSYDVMLILRYLIQQGGRRHTSERTTSTRDELYTSQLMIYWEDKCYICRAISVLTRFLVYYSIFLEEVVS